MGSAGLEIRNTSDPQVRTIRLAGEVDYAASIELSHELDRAVDSCGKDLLLDLQAVTLLDSEGIKLILRTVRRASRLSKRARVVRCSAAARRIIRLAGAEKLLGISGRSNDPVHSATQS